MKKIFFIFLLIFILLSFIWSEELKLVIRKTTIKNDLTTDAKFSDMNKETEKNNSEKIEKELRLGAGYICIVENNIKHIYDFENNNIFKIDIENKIYNKYSLFSVLGFNVAEIQNRFYLKKMFESSIKETMSSDKSFNLETLFCIVYDKKNVPEVAVEKKEEYIIYKNENEKYVTCKYNKSNDYKSYLEIYYRYLVYECVIHPEIIRQISNEDKFPDFLEYKYINMNTELIEKKEIIKFELVDEMSFFIPEGYKEEYLVNEKVMDVVINIKDKKINKTTEEEYKNFINTQFKKRNYLDAYLGVLEHALETGILLEEENKMVFTKYNKDKLFKKYIEGLMLSREEKYEEANNIFESIDRTKLKKGYIINTQIGAMYLSMNKTEDAINAYLDVLKYNPYVTGAIKDLGDLFYNRYDTVTSWYLWNLAREIGPEHGMLSNIANYEKQMIKAFPEYFF